MKDSSLFCSIAVGGLIFGMLSGCIQPEADERPVASREERVERQDKDNSLLSTRYSLLIQQLGADDWPTREKAQKLLEEIGAPALEPLQKALKESKDPEIRMRANRLILDIEWAERIKKLPQTFGEQYYNWIRKGQKLGYMKLSVKDAEYQGQSVFQVESKWELIHPEGHWTIEATYYTQKDRYLTLLYGEGKGSGLMRFNLTFEKKDGKGHLTGQMKGKVEMTLNETIEIPENALSCDRFFIWATALPLKQNLSFDYTLFNLRAEDGPEWLETEPLEFVGEEGIDLNYQKINCYKFTGKLQGDNLYLWIDKDQRLIKSIYEAWNYEAILTDKEDALKMPENFKDEKN